MMPRETWWDLRAGSGEALSDGGKRKTPRLCRPGRAGLQSMLAASAAVADQAQQHQKQVDEVEIERQRAHHRLASGRLAVVGGVIHVP